MSTGGRSWFGWPASGRPRDPNKEEFEKVRILRLFHDRICRACGQGSMLFCNVNGCGQRITMSRTDVLASILHMSLHCRALLAALCGILIL